MFIEGCLVQILIEIGPVVLEREIFFTSVQFHYVAIISSRKGHDRPLSLGHSHGTRGRISYGQNLTDDRRKSGWSWLIRIQYGYRTVLLRIITEDQGQFAKLVIIDSGMIQFNTV